MGVNFYRRRRWKACTHLGDLAGRLFIAEVFSVKALSLMSPPSLIFWAWLISMFFNTVVLGNSPGWGSLLYSYGIAVFIVTYSALHYVFGVRYRWKYVSGGGVGDGSRPASALVIKFYWLVSALAVVAIIYRIYSIGLNGAYDRIFLNLRYDISFGDGDVYHAAHLSLFPFALCLYYCYFGKKALAGIAGCIYLLAALSFAQRTSMFFLFCSVAYVLYLRSYISLRFIGFGLLLLIILFVLVAVGAGKGGGERGYEFIPLYIGYAISNLDSGVKVLESQGCGRLVFGVVYDLVMLGDLSSCEAGMDLFYAKDIFNVYTYVASPFIFAGVGGVTLAMTILAFFYFYLWGKCKAGRNGFFLTISAIYSYALLMVFYAWQFSLTTYYYLFILLIPLFYRFRGGRSLV